MVQSDFCRDISYNDPSVSYNEKMRCIFEEHDSFNNDQVENDIFNKTLDLHKKINEFNKIYACYVRKYYNTYNAPEYSLSPLGECEYIDNMSLNQALTYLEDKHSEIMTLIEELKTHTVDLNTYGQFDQIPEFSQMQKTHTYIKETRNDLDNKLAVKMGTKSILENLLFTTMMIIVILCFLTKHVCVICLMVLVYIMTLK